MPESQSLNVEHAAKARQSDGVILVLQDNKKKSLSIHTMNVQAETALGYSKGELVGRKFEVLLAPKLNELLAEELAYEPDTDDFGEIIARQRQLRMRHRLGDEMSLDFSLTRLGSEAGNPLFQLVLPNEREAFARQKIRQFISTNLEGRKQLDAVLGLPNRATAVEFLPLIRTFLAESNLPVAFAVLRIDRYEKAALRYGRDNCQELQKHVLQCCRSTFRSEDMMFALSENALGLLMVDLSRESARVVFNRLRWNIRTHRMDFGGKSDFSITTSVVLDMLTPTNSTELLKACEDAIANIPDDARNTLLELTS